MSARVALGGWLLFGLLAFALRSWLQWRRTGETGWRGLSGAPFSLEWLGGILFVLGAAVAVAAPVLALAGALAPIAALDVPAARLAGAALYAAGLALTLWAQLAMRESWRIGVDPTERTALVTRGPFRTMRNPIFTGMLAATAGLGLLVPSAAALAGFAVLFAAIEIQVRWVEEPHLRRVHGETYARYVERTGRFLPGW